MITLVLQLVILLFSAILHEIAHGYVADRLGDPTARLKGRLTLNPKSHIDPFMSILVPLFLLIGGSPVIIGAAKPVPVDPFNLKDGRKDMALVALAGPLTNVLIAIIAAILFHVTAPFFFVGAEILLLIVRLNLLLAIFNLFPIPPLDGSKIFSLILPEDSANAYLSLGNYGFFIILFLMMTPIGGFSLGALMYSLLQFSSGLLGL